MAFLCLLLYLGVIFLRPQEWVAAVHGWPLINMVAIATAVFYLFSSERKIVSSPQNYFMIGFLLALVISHLSHFYFGAALLAFGDFSKTIIMFFLIVNVVSSTKKMSLVVGLLVILAVIMALQGVMQFKTGYGLAGQPLMVSEGEAGRITWIGIFNDPNDLAMAFVIVVPFVLNWVFNSGILCKVAAVPVLGILFYGVYLTNSRGGMLSLLVVCSMYVLKLLKKNGFMILGVVVSAILIVLVFKLGPSRMANVSSADESSYGRIEAWYEGVQMLKGAPLFGVGYKMFTDYYSLTAHNSIVLCAAETGIVGLVLWVGLFYLSFKDLVKIQKHKEHTHETVIAYANALEISVIGFLASAFFLSRTYTPLPYMLIALVMAIFNIAKNEVPELDNRFSSIDARNICLIAFISLIGTYGIVKFAI